MLRLAPQSEPPQPPGGQAARSIYPSEAYRIDHAYRASTEWAARNLAKGYLARAPLTPLSAETGSNVRRTNGQILKHKLERGSLRAASNTAAMVATRRLPAFRGPVPIRGEVAAEDDVRQRMM